MEESERKVHLYGKLSHFLFWPSVAGLFLFTFIGILFSFLSGLLLEQGQDPLVFTIFMWISLAIALGICFPSGVAGLVFRCLLVKHKKRVPAFSESIYDFRVY